MTDNKETLNITDINGSKVFIENGEVKTVLSKELQESGYMSVEKLNQLLDAQNHLEKLWQL